MSGTNNSEREVIKMTMINRMKNENLRMYLITSVDSVHDV